MLIISLTNRVNDPPGGAPTPSIGGFFMPAIRAYQPAYQNILSLGDSHYIPGPPGPLKPEDGGETAGFAVFSC